MLFTNDNCIAQIENIYKAHVTQVKMQKCVRIDSKGSHQARRFLSSARIGDRSFENEL